MRLYLRQLPLLALLCAFFLPAQETAWQLDAGQTKVEYTLGDVLHTVRGSFTIERGTLRFVYNTIIYLRSLPPHQHRGLSMLGIVPSSPALDRVQYLSHTPSMISLFERKFD